MPSTDRDRRRGFLAASAALLLCGMAGCEDEGPPRLYPASGRVLVDGQPAEGVEVRLYPSGRVNDLDAPRPFDTTDADGAFQLGTAEAGDGAPAGRYKVTLVLPAGPPGAASVEDRLGGRYADPARSPLEAAIAEGETALELFEVETAATPARPKRRPARPAPPDPDGVS